MAIRKVERATLDRFKPGWRRSQRTGGWYTYEVDYTDPETGARRRRRGFLTEAEAQKFVHDLGVSVEMKRLGLVARSTESPLLRDVLQRALGDLATRRARTRATTVFRTFLGALPEGMTCDMLRTKQYKDYADARLRAGVKPETVNREMTFVRAALRRAHLNFPVLEEWTPPKGYHAPPSERGKRMRTVSEEEERRVLAELRRPRGKSEEEKEHAARVRTACIFEFALMTGLRHGEICAIRKSDVAEAELSVFRPKTKVWTTFPLTTRMREVIAEASAVSESEFVFSRRGKPQARTDDVLKRGCEAAGVVYGRGRGLVMHSARHTFITRLLHAGVDIATIQSFSSHTDKTMVMRYSHATEESRRRALGMLSGGTGLGEDELEELYRAVRSRKMSLEDFKRKIGGR